MARWACTHQGMQRGGGMQEAEHAGQACTAASAHQTQTCRTAGGPGRGAGGELACERTAGGAALPGRASHAALDLLRTGLVQQAVASIPPAALAQPRGAAPPPRTCLNSEGSRQWVARKSWAMPVTADSREAGRPSGCITSSMLRSGGLGACAGSAGSQLPSPGTAEESELLLFSDCQPGAVLPSCQRTRHQPTPCAGQLVSRDPTCPGLLPAHRRAWDAAPRRAGWPGAPRGPRWCGSTARRPPGAGRGLGSAPAARRKPGAQNVRAQSGSTKDGGGCEAPSPKTFQMTQRTFICRNGSATRLERVPSMLMLQSVSSCKTANWFRIKSDFHRLAESLPLISPTNNHILRPPSSFLLKQKVPQNIANSK